MRVTVIAMILLFLFSFLIDWYIWSDIRKYSSAKHRKAYSVVYIVLSLAFWAFLAVTLLMPRRSLNGSILPVMWMLYAYFSIYLSKAAYAICSLIGRIFRTRRNYGVIVGIPLGLLVFAIFWWGALVTRREIEVTHTDIVSDRIPASFDNFKIVQFSDAHVGTWGNDTTFISTLVDSINAQNPDVIFFTGDIVNRITDEIHPFVPVLSRLHAKHGVYSILGNHDYGDYADWSSPQAHRDNNIRLAEIQKGMNWTLLNNDYEFIHAGGDSIAVIGVENWGEPPFPTYGNLRMAYASKADSIHLNDDKYKILLTHNPEHWNREVRKISNIDLTLSGHTHAMQAMLKIGNWKWSPSSFKYDQWGGLYNDEEKPMNIYVNIGSGEVAFPARVGAAYPEVSVITLRRESAKEK